MIAADQMEFPGLLQHAAEAKPGGLAVDWSRRVRLGEHDLLLAANGAGGQPAASAVDAALEKFAAEGIVSTGFWRRAWPRELPDRRCCNWHGGLGWAGDIPGTGT